MHGVRPPQSGGNSTKFYFIPVDGLQSRKSKDAKPESQKYLTAARKHVMHDIGLSRRRPKKSKQAIAHDELPTRLLVASSRPKKHRELQPGHDEGLIFSWESVSGGQGHSSISEFNALNVNSVSAILSDEMHQFQPSALDSSRLDPFVNWPVSTTTRMLYLLDHLLLTDCESIHPVRSVSWSLLSLDPGIFYHGLAISAFCLSARYPTSRKGALISEGLFYYSKGLNSVNSRLGDKLQSKSDGIIASIMGLAIHTLTAPESHGWCWETAQSSPRKNEGAADQWILHFQALKTILDSRGGPESIASNRDLRHFLFIMDVEGTATRDVQPFFKLPPYILGNARSLRSSRNPTVAACVSSWIQAFPAQHAVVEIFFDLDRTISWLSGRLVPQNVTFWGHPDVDANWLLPLLHRCLQLAKNNASDRVTEEDIATSGPCGDAFQDALRHAMILFLAPIRRCCGPPALGTDLHITKLISALELCLDHPAAMNLQRLIFWMLVVGALEACNLGRDATWFFSRIVDGCANIGAKEFEDVRNTVKFGMTRLIWLEEAMSSTFSAMMKNLCIFMEIPSTIE